MITHTEADVEAAAMAWLTGPGWGSTEFIVMRAIHPVPPEYAYLVARHQAFREHAIQGMTGTSGRQPCPS